MRILLVTLVIVFLLHCPSVWAVEEVTERAVPMVPLMQPLPPLSGSARGGSTAGGGAAAGGQLSMEQQVGFLQQQVQTLMAQVAALQSVLIVTPAGATLQAPTLSLLSIDGTTIRSSKGIAVEAGISIDMKSAAGTRIRAGSTASVEAGGTLDLKGALIKLNGGTKPLATVGSQVQVPGQPIGQVATGSQTILGN
jgi:hypothetical protein